LEAWKKQGKKGFGGCIITHFMLHSFGSKGNCAKARNEKGNQ